MNTLYFPDYPWLDYFLAGYINVGPHIGNDRIQQAADFVNKESEERVISFLSEAKEFIELSDFPVKKFEHAANTVFHGDINEIKAWLYWMILFVENELKGKKNSQQI